MPAPDSRPWGRHLTFGSIVGAIRRGYSQFLAVPTMVLGAFLVLAVVSYILDRLGSRGNTELVWLGAVRAFLRNHIFSNPAATASLLSTVAGSVITVTSITFSMLLLAVQQSAASLSNQVYDQFLRRHENQFYFGFFVGLAVYSLVILSTVNPPFNPIFGGTLALVLTFVGLCLLVVLLYSTINQMHPAVIVAAIHAHILDARIQQLRILEKTLRASRFAGSVALPVRMHDAGFVTGFAIDRLGRDLTRIGPEVEVVMLVTVGSFVVYGQSVAEVHATSRAQAEQLADAVRRAISLGVLRDITSDPGFGIREVATIGWTSISTAKANPSTGRLAIDVLHDALARWLAGHAEEVDGRYPRSHDDHIPSNGSKSPPVVHPVVYPVVYPDEVVEHALDALGSLVVPASNSKEFQSLAAIVRALSDLYDSLPPHLRSRTDTIVQVLIATLGTQLLIPALDSALCDLSQTLRDNGNTQLAEALRDARDQMSRQLGQIGTL